MRTTSGSNAPEAALLGRSGECAAIEDLLSDARGGQSGVLVIRGEPGSGTTSLLDWAVVRADEMRVLRACGVESESELPFSGLAGLLGPVLDLRVCLPAPQAAALAGALAIGPPPPGGPFAAYAATLSLLAAAAEGGPVVVIVDDSHWLDSASLEALVFTARRIRAEGIVILFAIRAAERTALDAAGLTELALVGLDLDAAAALVQRAAGAWVAPAVAEHLHASTVGNPLALIELAGPAEP
jgi:AAA ATPase domain